MRRAIGLLGFVGYYLFELLRSSLRVAYDALTPRLRARPAIVAIPRRTRSDGELALVSSLITLTPGTMTLDLSDDGRMILVHAMYGDDLEDLRRELDEGIQRRALALLRRGEEGDR